MKKGDSLYQQYIEILKEELVPAMGCTEPIAIAYCGAKARDVLGGMPDKVTLYVSGNIVKNVKSVVVPNTNGLKGIEAAAAAGLDSVEHGAYLDKDALQTMADMGTVWVPTLSTIGNLRGKGRFNEDAVRKILDSALQNVHDFAGMGGLVAPGSDAGAWAVPHGSMTEEGLLEIALGGSTAAVLEKGTRKIKEKF